MVVNLPLEEPEREQGVKYENTHTDGVSGGGLNQIDDPMEDNVFGVPID